MTHAQPIQLAMGQSLFFPVLLVFHLFLSSSLTLRSRSSPSNFFFFLSLGIRPGTRTSVKGKRCTGNLLRRSFFEKDGCTEEFQGSTILEGLFGNLVVIGRTLTSFFELIEILVLPIDPQFDGKRM